MTLSSTLIPNVEGGEAMTVLDLFSGIGGFSLGLERAGMETVAFCEISPVCRHLLAHHWPAVPIFPDITTLTGADVGPVDVICGGSPCQDISFAGKDAGRAVVNAGSGRHGASDEALSSGRDSPFHPGWWSAEPDVGRVAHGVPHGMDRLAALGNAVVPQIPEIIGRAILTSCSAQRTLAA